jgi:hypothetical protein
VRLVTATGNIGVMPLIPALILAAVLLGLVLGGSLRGFEHVRIHRWGLALLGFGLQWVPGVELWGVPPSVIGPVVLAVSYGLLVVFLLSNRWVPGARLMSLGLVLNLAVVMVNGGMPVQAEAIERAGGDPFVLSQSEAAKHHLMTEDDMLWQLGDIVAVPAPVGDVFSIGDLLLYSGMVYSVVQIMRGRRRENPRPLAWWFPAYRGKHAPDYWRMPVRYRDQDRAEAGRSGTEP